MDVLNIIFPESAGSPFGIIFSIGTIALILQLYGENNQ